jgi:transcriptional regulator with XRE-family HTH domain
MEIAGQRLRRARERLGLRFRDVELASQQIAQRHNNDDFGVLISRLSDIESHGTLPSIYRLYSLCCIYRLDLVEVLGWFGIPMDSMASDVCSVQIEKTHPISLNPDGAEVLLPISLDPGLDLRRTTFLSEVVQRWGKLPLALVGGSDIKRYRYGFVGTADWSMNPTIPAGALLVVDDSKRKIQTSGWRNQEERPIYFVGTRDGYFCRWLSLKDGIVSLIPDPSSDAPVLTYPLDEVDMIGQVVGLAISLDPEKRPRSRS